jgi:beta-glucosidase
MPLKELKAFERVYVQKGEVTNIQIKIPLVDLQKWVVQKNAWMIYPGEYKLLIGADSRDIRLNTSFVIKPGIK